MEVKVRLIVTGEGREFDSLSILYNLVILSLTLNVFIRKPMTTSHLAKKLLPIKEKNSRKFGYHHHHLIKKFIINNESKNSPSFTSQILPSLPSFYYSSPEILQPKHSLPSAHHFLLHYSPFPISCWKKALQPQRILRILLLAPQPIRRSLRRVSHPGSCILGRVAYSLGCVADLACCSRDGYTEKRRLRRLVFDD